MKHETYNRIKTEYNRRHPFDVLMILIKLTNPALTVHLSSTMPLVTYMCQDTPHAVALKRLDIIQVMSNCFAFLNVGAFSAPCPTAHSYQPE